MRIPDPYAFYPPRWSDYDCRALVVHLSPDFSTAANVNRFAARYRLARAFRGLELEGYRDATLLGYNALTRVTLAWSAFEGLLPAVRLHLGDIPSIRARYNSAACLADLRQADQSGKFLAFIRDRLTKKSQREELDKYLDGKDCCVLTIARGVRHIFVHGPLTPNANQADPNAVTAVCDRLAVMLRRTMDREFSGRVDRLVQMFPDKEDLDDHDVPF